MKKRIRKKANKAIEGKIAQLHEIGREFAKLKVFHFEMDNKIFNDDVEVKAMMQIENLLKLPFLQKDEITIEERRDSHYAFEVNFIFHDMRFYTLISHEEYAHFFPERIKHHIDYIEIAGSIYQKVEENE